MELGIGTIESALPALEDGLSTIMVFAELSQINAELGMIKDYAMLAMKAMILNRELVSSPIATMPDHQTSAVELGTGKIKNASLAQDGGLSMLREFACLFPINAELTLTTELVPTVSRVMI